VRPLALLLWILGPWLVPPAQIKNRSSAPEAVPFPEGTTFLPDQVYCRPDSQTELCLDLACPRGKGHFPVVIFLHGGGWVAGSRKTYLPYMVRPVQEGYVAVSVTYRLAPEHPFPAALHDVKCAVRWLRAHAARFALDPQRLGVVGYSAGGHLACLLGTTAGQADLEGDGGCAGHSSGVQAVVGYYALTDLPAMQAAWRKNELDLWEGGRTVLALHSFLGGPPKEGDDLYARASPVTHASRSSAPTLLIHGAHDRQVPFDQSRRLEAKLKTAGAEVSLLTVEGAGHNFEGEAEKAPTEAMLRFLNRHLRGR
jgi:acetyl esterase/lipase